MVRKAGSGRVWEVWPPFAGSELLVLRLKTKNGTRGRKLEENWQICFCLVEFITEGLFLFYNALLANILLEYLVSKTCKMFTIWLKVSPHRWSLENNSSEGIDAPSPPSSTGFVLPGVERVRSLPNTHFGIFQPHERK